jgi:hypothetical protein
MAVELTEADMHASISSAELDALAKRIISGTPGSNPIEEAIADSLGVIELYCDPRLIPDAPLKKLWRTLAICSVYNRLAILPDKRKDEQTWAIKVLEQIRDGKFPGLLPDPDKLENLDETATGYETSTGAFGSADNASTFRVVGRP